MALKIVEAVKNAFGLHKEPLIKTPPLKAGEVLPWEDDPSTGQTTPQDYTPQVYVEPEPVTPTGGWLGAPKPKGLIVGASSDSTTKFTFKKAPPSPAKAPPAPPKPVALPSTPYVPSTATGSHYTILDAIEEFANGRKGTLMLVKTSGGGGYKVVSHDRQTGKTKLVGENGMTFNPKIGIREVDFYSAVWR